jgi:thiol-disulfide isomerase/thioredoxin
MDNRKVFSVLLILMFAFVSCVSETSTDTSESKNKVAKEKDNAQMASLADPVITRQVQESTIADGGEIVLGNEVGNDIGDFESYSPDSTILKLSDYRGKLTLLVLWNSLCGHCVTDNQKHAETYNKYHDKQFVNGDGFDIFAIALDKERATWIENLQKMNYPWSGNIYVIDSWKDPEIRFFGIKNLPGTFLIDENGIIVAKGFTPTELTGLLDGYLKK